MCPLCLLPPTDPTLTLTKLTQLLRGVYWGGLRRGLHIPDSKYKAIRDQYPDDTDHQGEAILKWYLDHHPAPSWRQVAVALYNWGEHEVLQSVRDQVPFLKGRSQAVCILRTYMS